MSLANYGCNPGESSLPEAPAGGHQAALTGRPASSPAVRRTARPPWTGWWWMGAGVPSPAVADRVKLSGEHAPLGVELRAYLSSLRHRVRPARIPIAGRIRVRPREPSPGMPGGPAGDAHVRLQFAFAVARTRSHRAIDDPRSRRGEVGVGVRAAASCGDARPGRRIRAVQRKTCDHGPEPRSAPAPGRTGCPAVTRTAGRTGGQ